MKTNNLKIKVDQMSAEKQHDLMIMQLKEIEKHSRRALLLTIVGVSIILIIMIIRFFF